MIDCYRQECNRIANYLSNNKHDPFVDIVKKSEGKKMRGLMSFAKKENMKDFKQRTTKERIANFMEMPPHGQWFKQHEEIMTV